MAEALRASFMMPLEERAERMSAIQKHITKHDVYEWADDFLGKSMWLQKTHSKTTSFSLTEKFRKLISVFDL